MNEEPRVLVCDEQTPALRALERVMPDAGFTTLTAQSATEALQAATVRGVDAAILDLVLPDGDGIDVCRTLRGWSDMPIIVLSAIGDEDHKVLAFAAGADDYITKPFNPRELVARLRAALRRARTAPAGEPTIHVDDLDIDLVARIVRRGGEEVHLTPVEFELLRMLARNRGRLLTHRALLQEVWGPAHVVDVPTLRTSIARLRRKIEPDDGQGPHYIRTDQGVGYRFAR